MNPLLSGSVLAATMFLGQTPEPPVLPPLNAGKAVVKGEAQAPALQQTQAQVQPAQPTPRPATGWFNREDRPIISKIQSWFKRDTPNPQQPPFIQPASNSKVRDYAPPIVTPSPPTDFPRKLPNPSTQGKPAFPSVAKESALTPEKKVQQTNLQQTPAAANAKSPILPQLMDKIGRDEKFDWITGQLELENGVYVIYYGTPETVDKLNGRIVLAPQQVDMKSFRRGDLVSVRGQLGQRQTLQGAAPVYRLTDASLIERPKL